MNNNHYFGRISDTMFNKIQSFKELVTYFKKEKRYGLSEEEIYNGFQLRFKAYKKFLEEELPEFTVEEILKIDNYYSKLKKIYEYYNSHDLLIALEYEKRTSKLNEE